MSINIEIIRETFEQVKPIAPNVINHFYQILFQNYPESRTLFKKTKMTNQKQVLIKSLVFIVENIENPNTLVPYLKKMGARHVNYGTTPEHYSQVGQSLIDTFAHFFAENWTSEAEEAWSRAIELIATTMLEGAQKGSSSTPTKQGKQGKIERDDSIELVAKGLANNLLRQYLESMDSEIITLAKERAKKILIKSLEDEASKMIKGSFRKTA